MAESSVPRDALSAAPAAAEESRETRRARVPARTLMSYGLPAVGFSFYLFFIQFYFLNYATDVLLLAPGAIGLLFGLGRIWDAISDPLIGYLSDRTRTRIGRRRPWMFAALPFLALTFVMVWNPPFSLTGNELVLWAGVALFGFYTAFTVYVVPHSALGAEISSDHHQRSWVFAVSRVGFSVGMMLPFIAMHFVTNSDDPRAVASFISLLAVVLVTAVLLIPPSFLRERRDFQGRGSGKPYAAFRDVFQNRYGRLLFIVWFIDSLGGGVLGVLAPYLTKYVAKRPDLIAVVPAYFMVATILSIPVWVRLSRRFGKRNVWLVGMVGTGTCFGGTFFLQPDQVALLCALMVGAGACMATGGVIGYSILADVIDFDEYRTGERKEGAYSASFSFALKLAIGSMIILTGAVLQLSGFVPNVDQTPTAELAIRGLFAGVPFVAFLAGALLFRRFDLGEEEHARIALELERRRRATPA